MNLSITNPNNGTLRGTMTNPPRRIAIARINPLLSGIHEADTLSSHELAKRAEKADTIGQYRRGRRNDDSARLHASRYRTVSDRALLECIQAYARVESKRRMLHSFIVRSEGEYRPHWCDYRSGAVRLTTDRAFQTIPTHFYWKARRSGYVRIPVRGTYRDVRVYENRMEPHHNQEDIVQNVRLGMIEAHYNGHAPSFGTLIYTGQALFAAAKGWTGNPDQDDPTAEDANSTHTAPRRWADAFIADPDRMVSNDPGASRKIADAEELNRRIVRLRESARDETDATIIQLLYNGQSMDAIGRAVGITQQAISKRVIRMKESVLRAETAAA